MAETISTTMQPALSDVRRRSQALLELPQWSDPRWAFGGLLTLYGVLGFSVFGFNRSPWQMLFIVVTGSILDVGCRRVMRGAVVFPLSAWISRHTLDGRGNSGSVLTVYDVVFGTAVWPTADIHQQPVGVVDDIERDFLAEMLLPVRDASDVKP